MNEAANFNYGLLMAELNKMELAEKALRNVIEVNTQNASAAYNLVIIVSQNDLSEAQSISKLAMDATPKNPKFAYTYAFFLHQNNEKEKAIQVLTRLFSEQPSFISAAFLLGQIYVEQNNFQAAIAVYESAITSNNNNQQIVTQLMQLINQLK